METGKSPTISICIPTYNQTVYLEVLLQSIAGQTFTDFEIIISDDSTNDDVKSLVGKFPFSEKLRYFRNSPSLGSPENWNSAIARATGQYVKIMHHDDAFAGEMALEEFVNSARVNNYDYIFSDSRTENAKDAALNRSHRIRNFNKLNRKPYLLFFGNSLGGPSVLLIKKTELANLQYDRRFVWLVDIEYYIRLLQTSFKGGTISSPLILTHDQADHQLTTTILGDFELQIREQALLYNLIAASVPAFTKFLMQVHIVRLLFKSGKSDRDVTKHFNLTPRLVKMYFSSVRIKPLYFAYYLFIRAADLVRKTFVI